MRLKLLTLLLALGALLTALALPTYPHTHAQDGTPVPPEFVFDAPRLVARPPLGETFDTAAGWEPAGLWRFETSAGFDGAGWRVDGAQRGMTSTLGFDELIDLSGSTGAQLIYRQRGSLPDTDIVAVELSLDGGQTWVAADQQFGIESDWEQRMVDLRFYRGQVVRLRFRVTTGAGALDVSRSGLPPDYALDNVAFQPFLDAPDRIYFPLNTSPRALLGLHMIMGAQGEPVIELARRLQAIGRPMSTLKGTTGTENVLAEMRRVSPETVLIYRALMTPDGMQDCPNTANDPVIEAQRWMNNQWQYWNGVTADYFEIMNECHPPMEWMVPFTIEAMRLANERGLCLLVFSFAGGNPEPHEYATLAPVYDYALDNPCGPQRYHGVAMHAYAGDGGNLLSESGPWMAYRHRKFYELLLPQLPEAYYIPVYITEAGPADGRVDLSCADLARDVVQFTREIERDPYVQGFNWWTVGPPEGTWTDMTPCLGEIGDALIRYYTGGR